MNSVPFKNQILFVIYFGLSTLITWWFVTASPLYISSGQQLLSTAIAGGKWGLQIVLAFILLGTKRWPFIRNIGFVCFLGSCILIPYIAMSSVGIANGVHFFVGSLVASVVAMICYYYKAIRSTGVSIKWWFFWLACLATAIILQLTVVFNVL
jgi:hypothetical protein